MGLGSKHPLLCFVVLSLWLWANQWTWLIVCSFMCLLVSNENFSQCKIYLQQYFYGVFFEGRLHLKKKAFHAQKISFLPFFFFSFLKPNIENNSSLNQELLFLKENLETKFLCQQPFFFLKKKTHPFHGSFQAIVTGQRNAWFVTCSVLIQLLQSQISTDTGVFQKPIGCVLYDS